MSKSTSSLFRSDEMTLCQFFLQPEAAYHCASELGELSLAQFRDCNPNKNVFQRQFITDVRRCDELERKLRFFETELKKHDIKIADTDEYPEAPNPREITELETHIDKLDVELQEFNGNAVKLKRNFLECTELKHVLEKSQLLLNEGGLEGRRGSSSMITNLVSEPAQSTGDASRAADKAANAQLGFISGVIHRGRVPAFERMLWRVSRGNVLLRYMDIEAALEDPVTGDPVQLVVFIVFFQGGQLLARVKKMCDGFRAKLYPVPDTATERNDLALNIRTRMEDLKTVLSQTDDHRHHVVEQASRQLKTWMIKVRKIKAIYHTMNLFNLSTTHNCFIAEAWIPNVDLEKVQDSIERGTRKAGGTIPSILNPMKSSETPPTFNRLNKFTTVFQNLIDSFGVASYREVNPAPYTIITFPFLFAVMFGDSGHALIMLFFGLWMVVKEKDLQQQMKKWNSEIFSMFFGGRYVILLMGIFSFYTGLIYNDVFSKSMNIFTSSWYVNNETGLTPHYIHTQKTVMLDPVTNHKDHPYPMGLDPVWQVSDNKISFLNAYKMKISIIIGVVHMLFGVSLSLWNHIQFKRTLDIFFGFIPQMMFLLFLFMYLNALVMFKWVVYHADGGIERGAHCAPSILITFINMVLFSSGEPPDVMCSGAEGRTNGAYMYPQQELIQKVLVVVAVLCIPWMLVAKPFVIRALHNRKHPPSKSPKKVKSSDSEILADSEDPEAGDHKKINGDVSSHGHGSEEEFDFAEVFIHEALHTIEFVLGSISHTASYLRLWALSLAHAQLSEVLWSMVMRIGLQQKEFYGAAILFAIFAAWAVLTVAILVLMEGLSAFLHTLRLHWIEFQSKFYAGEGYPFTPFSFKDILQQAEDADEA